jgi:hypothetical protein
MGWMDGWVGGWMELTGENFDIGGGAGRTSWVEN